MSSLARGRESRRRGRCTRAFGPALPRSGQPRRSRAQLPARRRPARARKPPPPFPEKSGTSAGCVAPATSLRLLPRPSPRPLSSAGRSVSALDPTLARPAIRRRPPRIALPWPRGRKGRDRRRWRRCLHPRIRPSPFPRNRRPRRCPAAATGGRRAPAPSRLPSASAERRRMPGGSGRGGSSPPRARCNTARSRPPWSRSWNRQSPAPARTRTRR